MRLPVRVLGFAPMFVCPLSGSTDLLIFFLHLYHVNTVVSPALVIIVLRII